MKRKIRLQTSTINFLRGAILICNLILIGVLAFYAYNDPSRSFFTRNFFNLNDLLIAISSYGISYAAMAAYDLIKTLYGYAQPELESAELNRFTNQMFFKILAGLCASAVFALLAINRIDTQSAMGRTTGGIILVQLIWLVIFVVVAIVDLWHYARDSGYFDNAAESITMAEYVRRVNECNGSKSSSHSHN